MLKPILLLPPVVALLIAGSWLGSQRKLISSLEVESAVLQKAIAARTTGAGGGSSRSQLEAAAKLAKNKLPLDWKKIAFEFEESLRQGGTMMRYNPRLGAMTQEELVTALDEIAALHLHHESTEMLVQSLICQLADKDPELALEKCVDLMHDSNGLIIARLCDAMLELAKKDPAKATAWLDQQIAAGNLDSKSLDGKSGSRNRLEEMLVIVLIGSDLDAAGRRLAALPGDQRSEILSNWSVGQIKKDDQPAFAKLVRDQVPGKDQGKTLGWFATRVAQKDGYPKVTEFLDSIQATPFERTTCVEQAAEYRTREMSYQGRVTREEFDAMREWVTAEAPGSTATITGKVLGNACCGNGKMDFAETSALAVEYNKVAGNDDVLTSFLESNGAWNSKEKARVLAGSILDAKRRAEILEKLK